MKKVNSIKGNNTNRQFQQRRVTVYGKRFERANSKYVDYPQIRFVGKWLADCGFTTGMKVKLTCSYRKIVITVDTNQNRCDP